MGRVCAFRSVWRTGIDLMIVKRAIRIGLLIGVSGFAGVLIGRRQATSSPSTVVPEPTQPIGSVRVPAEYGANQIVRSANGLSMGRLPTAFQFMMPDGRPGEHNYGAEGMPEVAEDATVYPVVVTDLAFGEQQNPRSNPADQIMPELTYIEGLHQELNAERNSTELIFKTRVYNYRYIDIILRPNGDRITALINCPFENPGFTPSSCAGNMHAFEGRWSSHIRFPRWKINSLQDILETEARLMASWRI